MMATSGLDRYLLAGGVTQILISTTSSNKRTFWTSYLAVNNGRRDDIEATERTGEEMQDRGQDWTFVDVFTHMGADLLPAPRRPLPRLLRHA